MTGTRRLLFTAASAAVVACAIAANPAVAASPLSFDLFFGSGGLTRVEGGPGLNQSQYRSVVVQPDGGFLAGRQDGEAGDNVVAIRHFSADGKGGRTVRTSFDGQVEAVDSVGRTLQAKDGNVYRFNPDGTPDATFDGVPDDPKEPRSAYVNFEVSRLMALPSGGVLAAGGSLGFDAEEREEEGEPAKLAEFDSAGSLVTSFGKDGIVDLGDLGIKAEDVVGLALGADNTVLVALNRLSRDYHGDAWNHSTSVLIAVRPDGSLDSAYGQGGVVRRPGAIAAMSGTPGGGALIAGDNWGKTLQYHVRASTIVVEKLTPTGAPNPSFGNGDGSLSLDLGGLDLVHSMLVDAGGALVIGGATTALTHNCVEFAEGFCTETPFVARVLPLGRLDPAFGKRGVSRLKHLSAAPVVLDGTGVLALAAAPEGGVLAGGGTGGSAFLAALAADGGLRPGFGDGGLVVEPNPQRGSTEGHAMAIDRQGRILVAGATNAGSAFGSGGGAIFRLSKRGRLDRGYGSGHGFQRVPGNSRAISAGSHGDAYVLSGKYAANAVSHLTTDGRPDPRFGNEGTAMLPGAIHVHRKGHDHRLFLDPRGIIAMPDGGVLVGGTAEESEFKRIEIVRLTARGLPDPKFGRRGVAIARFGKAEDADFEDFVLQKDGSIVIAAGIRGARQRPFDGRPGVIRLNPDGSPDHSFGRRGMVGFAKGGSGVASSVGIDRRGRVLVAGRENFGGLIGLFVHRLRPSGRPDVAFNRRAASTLPPPRRHRYTAPPRQLLQSAGRIFLARGDERLPLIALSRAGGFQRALLLKRSVKPREIVLAAAVRGRRLYALSSRLGGAGERGFYLRAFQTACPRSGRC
jgi:uncharacterized delta-60 repeat protein